MHGREEAMVSNSDVLITKHGVEMMLRRKINSADLIDAIYDSEEISATGEEGVEVRKHASGRINLEVICKQVRDDNKHYKIKVITVHKSVA
ncbi:MAG: hypothetical protein M1125_02090 [Candidatus Marsarchaeota archaeon]|nr:hypothetical protein [Candidatus Marsarchaeota archaeon]